MINTDGKVVLAPIAYILGGVAVLTIGFAIATLVLVLTMKSPRSVKANINVLQSSAISGKKLEAKENASKVFKERAAKPVKEDKKDDKKAKNDKKVDKKVKDVKKADKKAKDVKKVDKKGKKK
ncbi:MAG: hypothetical protein MJ223_00685 [Mycoplasmoidaceae bacterium]|nr:hypothetical protein [Mycoplasmoidaceae bacterium]